MKYVVLCLVFGFSQWFTTLNTQEIAPPVNLPTVKDGRLSFEDTGMTEAEIEEFFCNVSINYSQLGCGEIRLTIIGLYACTNFYTPLDGFKLGPNGSYEVGGRGSGTWIGGYGPSYDTEVDHDLIYQQTGQHGTQTFTVFLDYTYDCGGFTCNGYTQRSVSMTPC